MKNQEKIELDGNEICAAVEKLKPESGDVLLFYVKTNECGYPLLDLDTVSQAANNIGQLLPQHVGAVFLFDKINLFSVDDSKSMIKRLEETISYVREAVDKAGDIDFDNPALIDMEDVEKNNGFKRIV